MQKFMRLLGLKARDKVTGFEGVVTTVSFDLYGCVQVVLTPGVGKDGTGTIPEGRWFDEKRLRVIDDTPVMKVPTFVNVPGPAIKPAMPSGPLG
jgi:hypothetical protein